MKTLLKTDAVFSSLSIPYSRSDYRKLKRNITQRGCKEPICVWQGFIVDGHKRYDICRDKALAFSVRNMKFIYQEEAVAAGVNMAGLMVFAHKAARGEVVGDVPIQRRALA